MYLSTDDARSDFFLAAAVYVIGPAVLGAVLRSTGSLFASGIGGWVYAVGAPILLIAAMPLFLMRYRGERLGTVLGGTADAVPLALFVGAPIVLGTLGGDLMAGNAVSDGFLGTFQVPQILVARVVEWLSIALLATFLWRRAEYAFRPISEQMAVLVTRAAAGTIGAALVASLLLLPRAGSLGLVMAPLGFVGAFLVARSVVAPQGMGEQWRVYAPLITLALGPLNIFALLFDPLAFLVGLRSAGMVAGAGLLGIMALSRGRGGRFVVVLSLVVALLTSVTAFNL